MGLWHPILSHKRNTKVSLIFRIKTFMLSCRQLFIFVNFFYVIIEPANTSQPAVPTVSIPASQVMMCLMQDCNWFISILCRSLRKKHAHPAHCPVVRRLRVRWTNLRMSVSPLGGLMKLHLLLQRILSFKLPLAWHLIDLNLSPHDQQMLSLGQGLCLAA